MHTDIHFGHLTGNAKIAKAIEVIIKHLGMEKFIEVQQILLEAPVTLRQLDMAMGVSGIEGYPVKAWYTHLYGEARLAEELEDQTNSTDVIS